MITLRRARFVAGMAIFGLLVGFGWMASAADARPVLGQAEPSFLVGLTTRFSYQGSLTSEGQPATGAHDFRFRLYDAQVAGGQIGPEVAADAVAVRNGVFATDLDFGDVFNGRPRWVEVDVRASADLCDFSTLTPRQEIYPVPYALYAESALETWQFNTLDVDEATGALNGAYPMLFTTQDQANPQRVVMVAAPVAIKQVEAIHVLIARSGGEYADDFTLAFEVRAYDGTLLHTVSAVPLDLEAAPQREIIEIALAANPADLVVAPNEYLSLATRRSGEKGGSLFVALSAFVTVRDAIQSSTGDGR